jgi:ribonuclease HI
MKFIVYCDGSARNNGYENAVGAWAYVVLNDKEEILVEKCAAIKGATNQQMELMAAAEALEYLTYNELVVPFDSIEVITDSAYLHNCYEQKWYDNWISNGWKNAKKQPVANKDLWLRLVPFFTSWGFEFKKVKGHAGDKWNEYVDTLAQGEADKKKKEVENGNSNN